jgi:hypothetical protein
MPALHNSRKQDKTMKKLEVGSGHRPLENYDHCDINASLPDLTYVCPMWAIPVEGGAYGEVKAVHVIEHAPRHKWLDTLKDWRRILAPGGMAHIDTPNLERNIRLWNTGEWMRDFDILTPEEQTLCSIEGNPNRDLWINFKAFSSDAQFDLHYGNLTPELLMTYCRLAGFSRSEVYQTDPSVIVRAWK